MKHNSKLDIAKTFIELGNATSHNLEFSHRKNVFVSYGEETITETNLLEIRRQHPDVVRVHTFSKHMEAKNGADWEWRIIGRELAHTMRVQAKRVQSNCILKVKHKVKSSGQQQRDLLISGAYGAQMRPVYCIYCTERQRKFWKKDNPLPFGFRGFQFGCLLANAADVPLHTTYLHQVEKKCIPWHYLFLRVSMQAKERRHLLQTAHLQQFLISKQYMQPVAVDRAIGPPGESGWNAPTIDELNGETDRDFDRTGVAETTEEDLTRLEPETEAGRSMLSWDRERLLELGMSRMLVMDVRGSPNDESYGGRFR